jgi:hypothetical protein
MNFRSWLRSIEEASSAEPSQDIRRGSEGKYGSRAMLPVSFGLNNRAAASLIGGMGQTSAKILARKGAEPGQVPQLPNLEDMKRSMLKAIYMPLQLPTDYDEESGQVLYSGRNLMNRARGISPNNPLEDPGIWRVNKGDNASIVGGGSNMKTKLFTYNTSAGPHSNSSVYQSAVNFTEALMKVALMARIVQYSHVLNVDNPLLKDRQEFPTKPQDQQSNLIMMCSFVVNPKSKDAEIDSHDWQDVADRMDANNKNKKTPAAPAQPMPGTYSHNVGPGMSVPQTGPVTT